MLTCAGPEPGWESSRAYPPHAVQNLNRNANCKRRALVPSGGAEFSTGSISYAGALSTDDYDNDIARLTGNVLRRFIDPRPFDFPDSASG